MARKNYEIFSDVWAECGYTWDDMWDWVEKKMVPAMQIIHVEVTIVIYIGSVMIFAFPIVIIFNQVDHALNHIRRFILGIVVELGE